MGKKNKKSNKTKNEEILGFYSLLMYIIIASLYLIISLNPFSIIPFYVNISFVLIGLSFITKKSLKNYSPIFKLSNAALFGGIYGILFGLSSQIFYKKILINPFAIYGILFGLIFGALISKKKKDKKNDGEKDMENVVEKVIKPKEPSMIMSHDSSISFLHSESEKIRQLFKEKFEREIKNHEIPDFIKFALDKHIYNETRNEEIIFFKQTLISFLEGNREFVTAAEEFINDFMSFD